MSLIGNLINRFRRAPLNEPQTDAPPTRVRLEHEYAVVEDKLEPRAESLDEYYQMRPLRFLSDDIFRTMNYAEELQSEDGSSLDHDPRPYHVVLPDHNFQSHPESGLEFQNGRMEIRGHRETLQAVGMKDDFLGGEKQAAWDKKAHSFRITYYTDPQPSARGLQGAKSVLSQESFESDDNGTITESGKGARREAAVRAERILEAARGWSQRAGELDNSADDINKAEGTGVAPEVPAEKLFTGILQDEKMMSRAFQWSGAGGDEQETYQKFDLEKTPGSVFVTGTTDGVYSGASLWSQETENGLHVLVTRPEWGTVEKVHLNSQIGRVEYERLEKG